MGCIAILDPGQSPRLANLQLSYVSNTVCSSLLYIYWYSLIQNFTVSFLSNALIHKLRKIENSQQKVSSSSCVKTFNFNFISLRYGMDSISLALLAMGY